MAITVSAGAPQFANLPRPSRHRRDSGAVGVDVRSLSVSCHSTAANDPQASASFSAQNIPQRIPANTPPDVSSLRPCIRQWLICLATKDDSDRLLAVRDPRVKVFPSVPRDRSRTRQRGVVRRWSPISGRCACRSFCGNFRRGSPTMCMTTIVLSLMSSAQTGLGVSPIPGSPKAAIPSINSILV